MGSKVAARRKKVLADWLRRSGMFTAQPGAWSQIDGVYGFDLRIFAAIGGGAGNGERGPLNAIRSFLRFDQENDKQTILFAVTSKSDGPDDWVVVMRGGTFIAMFEPFILANERHYLRSEREVDR